MKRKIVIFLLLFLTWGLFSEEKSYSSEDFLNYMQENPGSRAPTENEEVLIKGYYFSVEDSTLNGKGVNYLVRFVVAKLSPSGYSRLIYIYGENIKTIIQPGGYGIPSARVIQNTIKLRNTGITAPALNLSGNRVEIPVFIAESIN